MSTSNPNPNPNLTSLLKVGFLESQRRYSAVAYGVYSMDGTDLLLYMLDASLGQIPAEGPLAGQRVQVATLRGVLGLRGDYFLQSLRSADLSSGYPNPNLPAYAGSFWAQLQDVLRRDPLSSDPSLLAAPLINVSASAQWDVARLTNGSVAFSLLYQYRNDR